jgi:hypothetical protein
MNDGPDHRRVPPPNAGRIARTLGALAIVMLLFGCGDDSTTDPDVTGATVVDDSPDPTLPGWLDEVQPGDGANAVENAVEVGYGELEPGRELRLVIDGLDVTAQLDGVDRSADGADVVFPRQGRLRYDPRDIERPLVDLDPGEHDAAIRLVELPDFGEQLRTVDEYAWTFTVQ